MSTVTAQTVRSYFAGNPAKAAALSDAARHTLRPGAKGRLHPDVVKAFNKGRKAGRRYETGATKAAASAAREQAAAARKAAAEAGLSVGKRGPLSKEALAVLKG